MKICDGHPTGNGKAKQRGARKGVLVVVVVVIVALALVVIVIVRVRVQCLADIPDLFSIRAKKKIVLYKTIVLYKMIVLYKTACSTHMGLGHTNLKEVQK